MTDKSFHRVSDHALLRYLERVRGFDFSREIAEIQRICQPIGDKGCVKAHGCRFEVRSGVVVTVTPGGPSLNATRKREAREGALA
jgi:hypothetical protein